MTKYFAKLGLNNKVLTVVCVNDSVATTEENGINFLKELYNYPDWIEASKDGSIRKNGAAIGFTYDENRDAFMPPQPYPSWTLNETTCQWEPPVAWPGDGKKYGWNEETTTWDEKIR